MNSEPKTTSFYRRLFNYFPQISYNAPVTLTLVILAALEITLATCFGSWITNTFFTSPSSIFQVGFFTFPTLFTYIFGHAGWDHFFGNAAWLVVLGPLIEDKYGSFTTILMIFITAVGTALIDATLGMPLVGASGIVFLFITLSSFSRTASGAWPLSFFLVAIFYLSHEVVASFSGDHIAHLGHLLGGAFGVLFGLFLNPKLTPKSNSLFL